MASIYAKGGKGNNTMTKHGPNPAHAQPGKGKAQPAAKFTQSAHREHNGYTQVRGRAGNTKGVETHNMVPTHLKGGKTLEHHIRECAGLQKRGY